VSKLQKEVDRLEGTNLFNTRWRSVLCSGVFVSVARSFELEHCQLRGCVELVCISLFWHVKINWFAIHVTLTDWRLLLILHDNGNHSELKLLIINFISSNAGFVGGAVVTVLKADWKE
jgi:hypothetical protein